MDTHEAVEGPFPMELDDGLKHWRVASHSGIGDHMLAGIVALGGTGPEQGTEVQGCSLSACDQHREGKRACTQTRTSVVAIFDFADLIDVSFAREIP